MLFHGAGFLPKRWNKKIAVGQQLNGFLQEGIPLPRSVYQEAMWTAIKGEGQMRDLNLKDVEDLVKCNHARQIGTTRFEDTLVPPHAQSIPSQSLSFLQVLARQRTQEVFWVQFGEAQVLHLHHG